MTSSSNKVKKGSKMLVRGVDCKAQAFKLSLVITKELDTIKEQS